MDGDWTQKKSIEQTLVTIGEAWLSQVPLPSELGT